MNQEMITAVYVDDDMISFRLKDGSKTPPENLGTALKALARFSSSKIWDMVRLAFITEGEWIELKSVKKTNLGKDRITLTWDHRRNQQKKGLPVHFYRCVEYPFLVIYWRNKLKNYGMYDLRNNEKKVLAKSQSITHLKQKAEVVAKELNLDKKGKVKL